MATPSRVFVGGAADTDTDGDSVRSVEFDDVFGVEPVAGDFSALAESAARASLRKFPEERTDADLKAIAAWIKRQPASVQRYFAFAFRDYRGQPDSARERQQLLCRNLKLLSVPTSTLLFKQGEVATSFYVILQGSCDVYHKLARHDGVADLNLPVTVSRSDLGAAVGRLSAGDCMGELPELFDGNRPASVVIASGGADGAAQLLQVDQPVYEAVIAPVFKVAAAGLAGRVNFLRKLHAFTGWPLRELYFLANWMLTETRSPRETLFSQDDPVKTVYFVMEGEVDLQMFDNHFIKDTLITVETVFRAGFISACDVINKPKSRAFTAVIGSREVKLLSVSALLLHRLLYSSTEGSTPLLYQQNTIEVLENLAELQDCWHSLRLSECEDRNAITMGYSLLHPIQLRYLPCGWCGEKNHGHNDCPTLFDGTSPPPVLGSATMSTPSPIKSTSIDLLQPSTSPGGPGGSKSPITATSAPSAGSPSYRSNAPGSLDKRLIALKSGDVSAGPRSGSPSPSSDGVARSPSIRRSSTPRSLRPRRRVGSVVGDDLLRDLKAASSPIPPTALDMKEATAELAAMRKAVGAFKRLLRASKDRAEKAAQGVFDTRSKKELRRPHPDAAQRKGALASLTVELMSGLKNGSLPAGVAPDRSASYAVNSLGMSANGAATPSPKVVDEPVSGTLFIRQRPPVSVRSAGNRRGGVNTNTATPTAAVPPPLTTSTSARSKTLSAMSAHHKSLKSLEAQKGAVLGSFRVAPLTTGARGGSDNDLTGTKTLRSTFSFIDRPTAAVRPQTPAEAYVPPPSPSKLDRRSEEVKIPLHGLKPEPVRIPYSNTFTGGFAEDDFDAVTGGALTPTIRVTVDSPSLTAMTLNGRDKERMQPWSLPQPGVPAKQPSPIVLPSSKYGALSAAKQGSSSTLSTAKAPLVVPGDEDGERPTRRLSGALKRQPSGANSSRSLSHLISPLQQPRSLAK